ncbi:MAG TPA: MFS transporter [Caulobacteraceae bacterium]|jgi:MFS family permease|nr:MFS transporter [Caulobacteraceae bacterium]
MTEVLRTTIPARLDRLPWTRFHTLVTAVLGITWILDGLEVTIVGALGPSLQSRATLALSTPQVGAAASFYLAGAIVGALAFGWVTDRFGRRLVVFGTLAVYVAGCIGTAFSFDFASFVIFRLITGLGIGGEYAAINSTIDELTPARYRGRVALMVNGSFWIGAAAGAAASSLLLDPRLLAPNIGWRLAFGIGGGLAGGVLLLRRFVPESPRWLITHGRAEAAEAVMRRIETDAGVEPGPTSGDAEIALATRETFGFAAVATALGRRHRTRALLVLGLMAAQAFLYNALFFTYGIVLTRFEGVAPAKVGLFLLPLAVGNFLGPLLLGPLFDTLGRKPMIAGTYGLSGLLMAATALAFAAGWLDARTQTLCWMAIFFFASAAASAAYLSASELFPLEVRALAIALFYAVGTLIGGLAGPIIFAGLIASGEPGRLAWGYGAAAAVMAAAALAQGRFGVAAEGRALEDVAPPLSLAMPGRLEPWS